MRLNFIRHGMTDGNKMKKYIGITDELLCTDGINQLKEHIYPECSYLFTSPMKRCIQTAEIIYPDMNFTVCDDFRECDFGRFENKNYIELSGDAYYQKWIDSNGTIPFPDGESVENFKERCISAFEKCIRSVLKYESVSFIIHGGTIMSVLEKYAFPKGSYYDFSIANAECYVTEFDGTKIIILEKI